jgi:hypothetical protein
MSLHTSSSSNDPLPASSFSSSPPLPLEDERKPLNAPESDRPTLASFPDAFTQGCTRSRGASD